MNMLNHILNFVYKRQKLVEAFVILLFFLSITFSFNRNKTGWIWENMPYVPIFFVTVGLFLVLMWLRSEKSKVQLTIQKIKYKYQSYDKLDNLTKQQRRVFDMIQAGKSNKEISNELFIELSTLKTHINKIYKTLEITSRKEAQNLNKTGD